MERRNFLKHSFAGMTAALIAASRSRASLSGSPRPSAPEENEVPGWVSSRWPATGPLRANPANPRYFTDGSGRAIFLTGSHTWANFQDFGPAPCGAFRLPRLHRHDGEA